MEIRQATPADAAAVRETARASLAASYDIDDAVIGDAVEAWYGDEFVTETTVLVAVDDGADDAVAGFSQSALLGGEGEVRWLHVHPEARGRGIGAELLDRTEELLREQGATRVEAKVLDANPEGAQFYETHGFERADEREIEVAGETFVEAFYETFSAERKGEPARLPDGDRAYVARDNAEEGSKGEFFAVYRDAERTERYGWLCDNCGGMEIAMDAMGRAECADCGNMRRPTRWDAAYL